MILNNLKVILSTYILIKASRDNLTTLNFFVVRKKITI